MRKILILLLLLSFGFGHSQELNCVVQVNSDKISKTNQQIFKTLEKSLNEFVNKTKWTTQPYKSKERIECSMVINVSSYSSDQFTATIQVQSSRPVYNSTYTTPIFNFNDKDFNFKYVEFESLVYNPNSFDSNLVSVMAFYSYIIIGLDADSFAPLGGTKYFSTAQEVVSLAQQSSYKGWSQQDGNQNRFFLVNDLQSNTFAPVREAVYGYNKGLDLMGDNLKEGKEQVKNAIISMQKVYDLRPNAFITRVFFDAKSDEIQSIFSSGPQVDITELVQNLNRLSPINAAKWSAVKF